MIILRKSIPNFYLYENFLNDFNISKEAFVRFNSTTDRKKRLNSKISGSRTGLFEHRSVKVEDGFEAVFYFEYIRGKEKEVKMDFLYNNEYLFKDVSAQTFIFITGISLNMIFNTRYDYSIINELYKCMRERNDSSNWKSVYDDILDNLKELMTGAYI